MIPLLQRVVVRARVDRVEGRKVWGVGEIRDAHDDTLYSTGEVLLVAPRTDDA